MSEDASAGRTATGTPSEVDFSELDDSALLSRRAQMRAEFEGLPAASPCHAALANDALEGDLYILRDQLRAALT